MVTVPSYQQNVALRPAYQQGVTTQASPDDMGAAVGRGMQQLAQGVGALGDSLQAVKDLEDETRVREARNQYMRDRDQLMYDPENGYMNTAGRNALDQRPAFNDNMRKLRERYANGLSPRQQNLFGKSIETLELDANRSAMVHNGSELKSYVVQTGKAAAENFQNEALRHWNNPAMADKYIAAGLNEIREVGRKQGASAEALEALEREFTSNTTKRTALVIAESDPLAADAYLKKNADRMTVEEKLSVENTIEDGVVNEKSKREAETILSVGRSASAGGAPAPHGRSLGSAGPTQARAYLQSKSNKAASHIDGLNEGFATNLAAMMQDAPPDIRDGLGVYSGFRSVERQTELWQGALAKYGSAARARKWVAPPGRSNHNHGQAVDLSYNGQSLKHAPANVRDWVHQNAGKYGLYFPMGHEPWHIEPMGTRGGRGPVDVGQVAPRNNNVSARVSMPSYDDIEVGLSKITDEKVRDATRKRIYAGIEAQSKAQEVQEKAAKAELWRHIEGGATPDDVPQSIRQAAGMSSVSSAWEYVEKTAKRGEVESDDELLYDMRRYSASNPVDFANVDLNDYRDRLSKDAIKELTEKQSSALSDQRKARENGVNIEGAYKLGDAALEAVGVTTTGKKDTAREEAAKRIAMFQNQLTMDMEAFKEQNNGRQPNQMEVQAMVNKLMLPIVIKQPGTFWDGEREGFFFERNMLADDETVDVAVEYSDIPRDLRNGISLDLERELGRKPSEDEIVARYEQIAIDTGQ